MIEILFYLFICCALLQLLFYLFVCSPFAFVKPKIFEQDKESIDKVSIIIAARNEAANLPALLNALQTQDYLNFEVIIANDRSEDDTAIILDRWEKGHAWLNSLHITEVPEGINPKKFALQKAISKANSEILLLTDADCVPISNSWVSSMVNAYLPNKEIVLGFSDYRAENTWLNYIIRWETFYTAVQYFTLAYIGLPYMGVGRNLSYKKSLFKEQGGFKEIEKITGGDDDLLVGKLANANNTALVYLKEGQTVSIPEKSWINWLKQKKRHLSVGTHYSKKIIVILGLIQISFIFFYLLLLVLLILAYKIVIIASVYLFRMFTVWIILSRIAVKFYGKQRSGYLSLFIPIFELFYVAYYIVAGIATLTNRKIKWK